MQFNKTSFWSLLSNNSVEKITIPIIQRAYTQGGRSGEPKIEIKGEKFLTRLIEALKGKPILLDFVYGSNAKNKIFPLDGQQRLTTLFLLHWYISQKEDKLDESAKNILKKFSYETRQSSRYFCEHLCNYKIDSSKRKDKLSDTIKNNKWFMLSWLDDPSIRSMFGMLDKIDLALKNDTNSYWNILTKDISNCPIIFFYTSLQDLNLTDDLYIRMNARGLELTDFEKLKAAFNQKVDDEKWDNAKILTEKFGHKIDTAWTDLFWQYRGNDELIDNELVNFIAGIAINCYAQKLEIQENNELEAIVRKELEAKSNGKAVTKEAIKRERTEQRIAELAKNANAICPDDFTNDYYNYLTNCLNRYAETCNDKIKSNIDLWGYCKSKLFEDFISGEEITYPKRVLFYAQTEYLFKNTFKQIAFDDWMRIIRNIVENSTIDSPSTFISAINLVNEISKGSSDIYNYLTTSTIKAGHATKQVKQEIEKAKIIVFDPSNNKQVIFDTEDTNFCKGDINFALHCIDYDSTNVATFDVAKLTNFQVIIKTDLNVENKVTEDFKRAFLTIQNNNYYDVWGSWSWNFDCQKRWLLNKNIDLISFAKSEDWKREYLKDLLVQRMSKSFAKIADEYTVLAGIPKWKEKLIKGSAKIAGATFILIPNDNSYCKLAWQQRPSREDQVTKIAN
jgi:hypothetical protein